MKSIIINLSLSFSTYHLSTEKVDHFEFLGYISADEQKAKGITVKVFSGNRCFSNYTTTGNGKFIFIGGSEKLYVLQFEKEGYVTKKIVINTQNTKELMERIDEYSFSIELLEEEVGENYYDFPTAVIEVDRMKNEFMYNKNYMNSIRNSMVEDAQLVSY